MKKQRLQSWLKYKYPTTIVLDRYHGSYSGGKWTAHTGDVPWQVDSGDIECGEFWSDVESRQHLWPIGIGGSPEEAYNDLVAKAEKAADTD